MRRHTLVVALFAGVLMIAVTAGSSSANTWTKETRLSINMSPSGQVDEGDRVLIYGRLRPEACQRDQRIQLMQVVPGPNEVLKSDTTDGDGEYSFRLRPGDDMKVYALFAGSVDNSYEHSHACTKSTSDRLVIDVG